MSHVQTLDEIVGLPDSSAPEFVFKFILNGFLKKIFNFYGVALQDANFK